MSFYSYFILLFIFVYSEIVYAVDFKRPFLYSETETLPDGIDIIIEYFAGTDYTLTEKKIKGITNTTLIPFFKECQKDKVDTVFAYIPNSDFEMINKLAVLYDIFIWNIVAYPTRVCYSNIMFGYDIDKSSLYSIHLYILIFLSSCKRN